MKIKIKIKAKLPKILRFQKLIRPLTAVLLLTAILFSGCYWNKPVIELISPPKLTGEQTEIYNALINSTGAALTLKYPKTGEYLSAFVFRENKSENKASNSELGENSYKNSPENSNENKQVMVFYELANSESAPTIHLTFLEKKDGRWISTNDIPFFAADIEKVEFAQLGDSDVENIIISTSILSNQDKSLFVVSFGGSKNPGENPENKYQRDFCVYYEIGDFDNSGSNMLMSINNPRSETSQAQAEFVAWQEEELIVKYTANTNPNAMEYIKSIKSSVRGSRENAALFLEYSAGDVYNTGIIAWLANSEGVIRPRNIIYTSDETTRNERIQMLEKRTNQYTALAFARDIDGDGDINPAGNQPFPGYSNAAPADRVCAAVWYAVVDRKLERRYYTFLGVNNDYVFFLPNDWEESVTVTVDNDLGEVVFWKYDASQYESIADFELDGKREKNRLLSIVSVPKGEKPENLDQLDELYELYESVGSNNNEQFDYYVKISNNSIQMWELRLALKIFKN